MRRATAGIGAARLIGASVAAAAAIVTVLYETEAVTVSESPSGLTVPSDTPVTGYFTAEGS